MIFMRQIRHLIVIVLVSSLVLHAEPPTTATTAPADALLGRWQLRSMGEKRIPADISIYWTFDERSVVVTDANGDVLSKSQYTTRPDGENQVISVTPDGEKEPDRVGWYLVEEGKLRIQFAMGTGKPPPGWNEKEVIVFASAPAE